MSDKKSQNPILVIGGIIIAIVIFANFGYKMYGAFMDGYTEAQSGQTPVVMTADDTRQMIENGAESMVLQFILDDPQMLIAVKTVAPGMSVFDLAQPGAAQQGLEAFALSEASKLMAHCDELQGDEARVCIETIDFTIPPYTP